MNRQVKRTKRTAEEAARAQEVTAKASRRGREKILFAGLLYLILLAVFFWPSTHGTLFQRVSAQVNDGWIGGSRMGAPKQFADTAADVNDPVRALLAKLSDPQRLEPEAALTGRLLADPARAEKLALLAGADLSKIRAPWRGKGWVKIEVPASGAAADAAYGVPPAPPVCLRVRLVARDKGWLCEDIKILSKHI